MSKKQNNYISAELEWVNFKLQELSTFLEKNKDNYKPRKVIRIVNADIHSNNKHYLYAHFTLDSEYPFYIGIGTQNNKTKLYNRACSKVGRNKMWLANTRDKPYFVLIMSSSNDYNHIKLQEIETINQYGRKIDNGILTNISIGGDGCLGYKHTEEHKLKLRETYTGINNPMYGKKMSEENKEKQRIRNKNRIISDSTREKLRQIMLLRGSTFGTKAKHPKAKKIYKIDPVTFNVLQMYNYIKEAALELGCSDKLIGQAARQKFKAKGFYWSYTNIINIEDYKSKRKKDVLKYSIIEDKELGLTVLQLCSKYNLSETHCRRILKSNKLCQ